MSKEVEKDMMSRDEIVLNALMVDLTPSKLGDDGGRKIGGERLNGVDDSQEY